MSSAKLAIKLLITRRTPELSSMIDSFMAHCQKINVTPIVEPSRGEGNRGNHTICMSGTTHLSVLVPRRKWVSEVAPVLHDRGRVGRASRAKTEKQSEKESPDHRPACALKNPLPEGNESPAPGATRNPDFPDSWFFVSSCPNQSAGISAVGRG